MKLVLLGFVLKVSVFILWCIRFDFWFVVVCVVFICAHACFGLYVSRSELTELLLLLGDWIFSVSVMFCSLGRAFTRFD